MNDKKVEFVEFRAINEFMIIDYMTQVLKSVFSRLDGLPLEWQKKINNEVKTKIVVGGFRNSIMAPAGLKARNAIKPFENDPVFVGVILQAWLLLHIELANNVKILLEERGWDILPVETDRTKLPGFMTRWPAKEDYQAILEAFHAAYPDSIDSDDDISLMCVWLSTRLPYLVKEEN